jgi:hypothetical protein
MMTQAVIELTLDRVNERVLSQQLQSHRFPRIATHLKMYLIQTKRTNLVLEKEISPQTCSLRSALSDVYTAISIKTGTR